MLGCTALEKTRCKKHGQAILFFQRNFSESYAILVCDFHFPKNICKTVIVSISQKWVCDNRAVPKLPWSFSFHCRSDFLSSTWSFLWHQSLSCRCKGMAAGFGNKRSSLRFSEKSPRRWVVFCPKNLVFPASPPLKGTWNETTDATGRRKKNVGKGSDKKVKKRELPFSSRNRK